MGLLIFFALSYYKIFFSLLKSQMGSVFVLYVALVLRICKWSINELHTSACGLSFNLGFLSVW